MLTSHDSDDFDRVAPYAGAWIEIAAQSAASAANTVAPYAGAWIEIPPI